MVSTLSGRRRSVPMTARTGFAPPAGTKPSVSIFILFFSLLWTSAASEFITNHGAALLAPSAEALEVSLSVHRHLRVRLGLPVAIMTLQHVLFPLRSQNHTLFTELMDLNRQFNNNVLVLVNRLTDDEVDLACPAGDVDALLRQVDDTVPPVKDRYHVPGGFLLNSIARAPFRSTLFFNAQRHMALCTSNSLGTIFKNLGRYRKDAIPAPADSTVRELLAKTASFVTVQARADDPDQLGVDLSTVFFTNYHNAYRHAACMIGARRRRPTAPPHVERMVPLLDPMLFTFLRNLACTQPTSDCDRGPLFPNQTPMCYAVFSDDRGQSQELTAHLRRVDRKIRGLPPTPNFVDLATRMLDEA